MRKVKRKLIVSRGAGPISNGSELIACTETECKIITDSDVKLDFCCCNTNLCNSAERVTMAVSILLTILFSII